jgi:hypothetical protein
MLAWAFDPRPAAATVRPTHRAPITANRRRVGACGPQLHTARPFAQPRGNIGGPANVRVRSAGRRSWVDDTAARLTPSVDYPHDWIGVNATCREGKLGDDR